MKSSVKPTNAEFVTADGFPIVTLAGLDGISIERTAGSDLIDPLCRSAAINGIPVFFFGTTFPALCSVARQLTAQIPNLDIRGVFSPPFGFGEKEDDSEEAIRVIVESGARICFLALSPPKQEIFAAAAMKRSVGISFIAVGAGLDFIAGHTNAESTTASAAKSGVGVAPCDQSKAPRRSLSPLRISVRGVTRAKDIWQMSKGDNRRQKSSIK